MEPRKNTLGKNERIKSKKVISALFDRKSLSNQSFLVFPFKVIFSVEKVLEPEECFPQVLISVSKKKFKRAVDRNLIKRRSKEAYRMHKKSSLQLIHVAFIYVANEILEFNTIEKAMIASLSRLK